MKQIGHSGASLYRYASIGRPFTNGSLGSWDSLCVISDNWLFDPVANDAKVLARPRRRAEVLLGDAKPELENAGCEADRLTDASDW